MFHSSESERRSTPSHKPVYPSSEFLVWLPVINPFITPVFPAPDYLDPPREIDNYNPDLIAESRIVRNYQGFSGLLERLKSKFRHRSDTH